MKNGNKRNGKTSLHPLSLEEALAAALKASPPPGKPRRGGEDNADQKRTEQATKIAIDIYEEALKELENY